MPVAQLVSIICKWPVEFQFALIALIVVLFFVYHLIKKNVC